MFEDRDDLIDTRERLFDMVDVTPHLDWLLLTKRPGKHRASRRTVGRLHRQDKCPVERVARDLRRRSSIPPIGSKRSVSMTRQSGSCPANRYSKPRGHRLPDRDRLGDRWRGVRPERTSDEPRLGAAAKSPVRRAGRPVLVQRNRDAGMDEGGGTLVGELIRELPQPAIGYTGYLAPELGEPV